MKKYFFLCIVLFSLPSFSEELVLVCQGTIKGEYQDPSNKSTVEPFTKTYKFIDGKYQGPGNTFMTNEKIQYECNKSKGCDSLISKYTMFTIDRISGDVLEVRVTDFDQKSKLDNMKMTFAGMCGEGKQKF